MDADLGGTERLKPLSQIYSSDESKESKARNIVLLTDGEAENEDEILQFTKRNRNEMVPGRTEASD
jgi:uncharacterized protein with von Willebrand factor type A (vWA) domain